MPTEEKKVFEGFNTPGPEPGKNPEHKIFEGFTTPGPAPDPNALPLDAWNEPAYIESLVAEGFTDSADEAFRFHIYRFGGGGAAAAGTKKAEHKEEHNRKGH
jgi:hypothetical protein